MGASLALGWNEQMVTTFDIMQGIKCNESGHVLLTNWLTFGWIELSPWCFVNGHIGLSDNKAMTNMVETHVEKLIRP